MPKIDVGEIPSEDALALPDGSIDTALEKLPDIVSAAMERRDVPGIAVAVVHGGETVFAEGYGVRKKNESATVDANTVFQIASVSKPISATVAATQVTQKVIKWDTPVSEVLPEFELADPWVTEHVTVGDFFAHRTGLPFAAGDSLEDIGYDREYVLDHLRHQPLAPLGTSYAYVNFGITVGAEAVASAAGTEWETLADEQLFTPLGMSSTSFRYDDFLSRDNRATLHTLTAEGEFEALYERNNDAASPAGGVSSSVTDLAEWMKLLLADGTYGGAPLISPAALLPAVSPQNFSSKPQTMTQRAGQYGFGFGVGVQPGGRVSLSHSGAFVLGAATNFQLLPSVDIGIIVLTNAAPIGVAEAIATEFLDIVQFGQSTRDWLTDYGHATAQYQEPAGDLSGVERPSDPAQPGPLSTYIGEYSNDYYGTATVTEQDGALSVAIGPAGVMVIPLEPWDSDVFAFTPTGENAPAGSFSSAAFTVEDGTATTMTLDFFNAEPGLLGTWMRVE
ncbi:serine hydrolase [Gulosibacter chungangensis]|uniref:Serine hydrolase n=1 Tax=Gulosibacter chungangensis TaxID=979746 RepID=A0A7J5BBQ9_9MICO|nr:serine hydrolase [Gulosibacter chungangensis]KAB1642712.1 serine hydrolase [Gulosibacter chungangensis]